MIVTEEVESKVEAFFDNLGVEVEAWDEDRNGNTIAVLDACPNEDLHTTDSTPSPWVYFNPYIKIQCRHQSCGDCNWDDSKKLWAALGKPEAEDGCVGHYSATIDPVREARKEARRLLNEQRDAVRSASRSGLITANFSGIRMPVNHKSIGNPYQAFLRTLWNPSDILWTGEADGSGEWAIDKGKCVFASARELAETGKPLHPFISNSSYKNNTMNRKNENVLDAKYIVLEFDGLTSEPPKDESTISENLRRSWWVFSYTAELLGLVHRATIYSGAKSLHFWCDRPSEDKMQWLRYCSKDLKLADSLSGLDTACLGPSQPCRTPSFFRTEKDREQKLLWLAGH